MSTDITFEGLPRDTVLAVVAEAMRGSAEDIAIERGLTAVTASGPGQVFGWDVKVISVGPATAVLLDHLTRRVRG